MREALHVVEVVLRVPEAAVGFLRGQSQPLLLLAPVHVQDDRGLEVLVLRPDVLQHSPLPSYLLEEPLARVHPDHVRVLIQHQQLLQRLRVLDPVDLLRPLDRVDPHRVAVYPHQLETLFPHDPRRV